MKALKALKPDRFASYINDILFNSTNEVDLQKLLNKIEEDILFCVKVNHTPSLQSLEQLLINLLGDPQPKSRELAAKLLNVIYDGHDWQVHFLKDIFLLSLRTQSLLFLLLEQLEIHLHLK
jgi:hypothetical protein